MFAQSGESADTRRVTSVTPFAGRLRWHLRALGFNPLVRVTDRLRALAVLGVLVTALVALPIGMSAGTLIYESDMQTANEQAHSRHSVDALVIDGAGLPSDLDTPSYVRAQWRDGTRMRTEQILSPATIRPGEHMKVWLDNSGRVVAAPLKPGDAKLNAVVAAGTSWIGIVLCSALLAFLVHKGLDRFRERAWERDLHLLAHSDDGWVNRRT
jgi:hypothetical protein